MNVKNVTLLIIDTNTRELLGEVKLDDLDFDNRLVRAMILNDIESELDDAHWDTGKGK